MHESVAYQDLNVPAGAEPEEDPGDYRLGVQLYADLLSQEAYRPLMPGGELRSPFRLVFQVPGRGIKIVTHVLTEGLEPPTTVP